MMESLFKLTELESRIPLNMNVLVRGRIPKVVGLAEALNEWLDASPRGAAFAARATGSARSSIGSKCSAAI